MFRKTSALEERCKRYTRLAEACAGLYGVWKTMPFKEGEIAVRPFLSDGGVSPYSLVVVELRPTHGRLAFPTELYSGGEITRLLQIEPTPAAYFVDYNEAGERVMLSRIGDEHLHPVTSSNGPSVEVCGNIRAMAVLLLQHSA